MKTNQIQEIKRLLESPKKIIIVPHQSPDGDAIGSSLAFYNYLKKLKHDVVVIAPNEYPKFLKWLPGTNYVEIFENDTIAANQKINDADVIFLLDFNALHRTGGLMEQSLRKSAAITIMIDHHQQPDDFANYLYSDTSICSTCQMVYHFFEKLEVLSLIDKEIATCLYTGIMTDTGSFRFPSTTSETHRIIANLMDKGANNAVIYNNVNDNNTYSRMQLLGKSLSNLKVLAEYRVAFIKLSASELEEFNFQKGDTEGFVNYGLSIENIVFAVIFIEDIEQNIIKMSFRSKGKFSVNQFARNYFNGGGHINAAGGRSELSLNDTIKKFLEIIPQYKDELLKSDELSR